jgi:MFS family permease
MSAKGKNILGIILGLAVAMTSFMLFETIAHFAYPLPSHVNTNDAESMKNYMPTIPTGALSLVLTGWIVGSVLAGYFAKMVSKNPSNRNAIILGLILESATIFNFILLPHPTWFIILSLLILIPAVFVGHALHKLPS